MGEYNLDKEKYQHVCHTLPQKKQTNVTTQEAQSPSGQACCRFPWPGGAARRSADWAGLTGH